MHGNINVRAVQYYSWLLREDAVPLTELLYQ